MKIQIINALALRGRYTSMTMYRFYHLGSDGRCVGSTEHTCSNDEHAVELASELANGRGGIEVFVSEGRRVGRVEPVR